MAVLQASVADGDPTAPSNDPGIASEEDLAHVLGRNLRRLRTRQGLSLERLAKVSGVSRAMLGQIELGRSVPTIGLLWKVAPRARRALRRADQQRRAQRDRRAAPGAFQDAGVA